MSATAGSSTGPGRIRDLNRRAVLGHLRRHGTESRSALATQLSLSPAAVSSVVQELIEDGFVQEAGPSAAQSRPGRPVALLELEPCAAYTLGIVLRARQGRVGVEMALSDYVGNVIHVEESLQCGLRCPTTIAGTVLEAVHQLESRVPDPARIAGLVVGIPGVVEGARVIVAPQLPAIEGDLLFNALREAFRYPFQLSNDVNLAAQSELHLQPELAESTFAYLYVGTGVGAGIVVAGAGLGGHGWAGEIGQLRITRAEGRRASFEELLGIENYLAAQMRELGLEPGDFEAFTHLLDERDSRAMQIAATYSEHLCDVIQVLNATLDLDTVLIDFPHAALLARLRPRVETVMQDSRLTVTIGHPVMGDRAAVNGAALTALWASLPVVEQRAIR